MGKSIIDLWNDYYTNLASELKQAKRKYLMVRLEDILFYTTSLMTKICTCSGGNMYKQFYFIDPVRVKGDSLDIPFDDNILAALKRFGSFSTRNKIFQTPNNHQIIYKKWTTYGPYYKK